MSWDIDGTFNEEFPNKEFIEVDFSFLASHVGTITTTEKKLAEDPEGVREAMIAKALDGLTDDDVKVEIL